MEYTTLGKTGLKISRMGFGGIPIQRIDAEGTKKLMQQLAEEGGGKLYRYSQRLHGQRGVSWLCP